MSRKTPRVAYISDDRYNAARKGGMSNFSKICDEALEKFIFNSAPPIQVNTPPRMRL